MFSHRHSKPGKCKQVHRRQRWLRPTLRQLKACGRDEVLPLLRLQIQPLRGCLATVDLAGHAVEHRGPWVAADKAQVLASAPGHSKLGKLPDTSVPRVLACADHYRRLAPRNLAPARKHELASVGPQAAVDAAPGDHRGRERTPARLNRRGQARPSQGHIRGGHNLADRARVDRAVAAATIGSVVDMCPDHERVGARMSQGHRVHKRPAVQASAADTHRRTERLVAHIPGDEPVQTETRKGRSLRGRELGAAGPDTHEPNGRLDAVAHGSAAANAAAERFGWDLRCRADGAIGRLPDAVEPTAAAVALGRRTLHAPCCLTETSLDLSA